MYQPVMSRYRQNDPSWANHTRHVTIQTGDTEFNLRGVTSTSTAISEIKRAIDNAHKLETTMNPSTTTHSFKVR